MMNENSERERERKREREREKEKKRMTPAFWKVSEGVISWWLRVVVDVASKLIQKIKVDVEAVICGVSKHVKCWFH